MNVKQSKTNESASKELERAAMYKRKKVVETKGMTLAQFKKWGCKCTG